MRAAILLPARFVMIGAEGTFLAPTGGLNPIGTDTERNQEVLRSIGPALTEAEVVFGRTAFVAMSLERDLYLRIRTQEFGVFCKNRACIVPQVGFIRIEVSVLNALREKFAHVRGCRRRRCGSRWRCIHCHAGTGRCGATGSSSRDGISGRAGRIHGSRTL